MATSRITTPLGRRPRVSWNVDLICTALFNIKGYQLALALDTADIGVVDTPAHLLEPEKGNDVNEMVNWECA